MRHRLSHRKDRLKGLNARYRAPEAAGRTGQRHFIAQRIVYHDAHIDVDLDTTDFARKKDGKTKVKQYPNLFDLFVAAVRDAPAGINKEVNFMAKFYYRDCPETRSESFKHNIADALTALEPLYDLLS